VLYDVTDADNPSDVSSTKTSGSITASGDVITTKRILSLVLDHVYRAEVKFTDSNSNIWECFFVINCQDK
jgi:hypothetical protein